MGPPKCPTCGELKKPLLQAPTFYCDCEDELSDWPELDDTLPGLPSFANWMEFED